MNFNSYIFILALLPVSLIGYYLTGKAKRTYAMVWLLCMSLVFYAYASWKYLILLLFSIAVNWGLTLILRVSHCGSKRPFWLTAGIVLNTALLVYYKYYNFFAENINSVFGLDLTIRKLILPLGISFFTFTQIAWLVDTYRGETKGYSFLEYALYVSFFPKLVQGPIALHGDIIPQFRDEKKSYLDYESMMRGIILFTLGLFKKVMIADTLGIAVDWTFSVDVHELYSMDIWLTMLIYSLQIYFDFSGYCDMASGIGYMFGIELPVNFNSPYKALSITDFWKRWHISLTSFLRKYIYFPLGGSKKGASRTYINMLIVFLVSGFWHGANWTFILWGLLHGLLQVLHRMTRRVYDRIFAPIRWLITFVLVNALWLLFRADCVSTWWFMVRKALSLKYFTVHEEFAMTFKIPGLRSILERFGLVYTDMGVYTFGMTMMLGICMFLCLVPQNNIKRDWKPSKGMLAVTVLVLTICILSLSKVTSFLYFNF